ncbi:branched-chain amino acid ABC transporter substrate-binding protein [Occultella glacieicola]|uniref:Branched-chain amino acid ABC transporter substrate-binding protein n=1 Tax=Occultella glacieicola TaxID=2518684 RepID=A0ABY2E238_9MICO|nr:amino acid ABC transporter substrate-binding protein [Occultella glacieicola]TDE92668.1 branched-chain amino acid ABC transporter substrate-binding protein [Occultella glacieicola]
MTTKTWAATAATTAAIALAVAGCAGQSGGGSDGEENPDDPIVIGVSLPLTGDFAEPGKGVQRGYEVWVDEINANGGLLGRQVELIVLDDGSDAARIVSDYESLIAQEGVDLLFGPFSTRLVVPSARVAQEYGMLFVEPAGAAAEVFESGFDNLFYAAPAIADDHYNHLAEYILSMPEDIRPQTAAYAAQDDPFAQGTAYGLRDQLEAAGIETVVDEVYPPNATDFNQIAAQIAAADADIVVGGTLYQDAVNLIIAMQQLGYQPRMAAFSTAPTNPEFPEALGSAVEGILSPTGYALEASYPSNVEFVEAYNEMFGTDPQEDEANAYTTGQVVAAAVEAVGCAEQGECQQQLIDWLRTNSVETVVGELSWDEAGRPQGAHMILQYVGGEIQIVLPEGEAQMTELVYPKPEW